MKANLATMIRELNWLGEDLQMSDPKFQRFTDVVKVFFEHRAPISVEAISCYNGRIIVKVSASEVCVFLEEALMGYQITLSAKGLETQPPDMWKMISNKQWLKA